MSRNNNTYGNNSYIIICNFCKKSPHINIDNIYFLTDYIHYTIKEIIILLFCYIFVIN